MRLTGSIVLEVTSMVSDPSALNLAWMLVLCAISQQCYIWRVSWSPSTVPFRWRAVSVRRMHRPSMSFAVFPIALLTVDEAVTVVNVAACGGNDILC